MNIMYFFIDQGIEHLRIKFITVKRINCMQDYSAINVLAWSDVMTTYLQCTNGVKKKRDDFRPRETKISLRELRV